MTQFCFTGICPGDDAATISPRVVSLPSSISLDFSPAQSWRRLNVANDTSEEVKKAGRQIRGAASQGEET
jgi:hypothetical protein